MLAKICTCQLNHTPAKIGYLQTYISASRSRQAGSKLLRAKFTETAKIDPGIDKLLFLAAFFFFFFFCPFKIYTEQLRGSLFSVYIK